MCRSTDPKVEWLVTSFLRTWLVSLMLVVLAALSTSVQAADWLPAVFPEADAVGEPIGEPQVLLVVRGDEVVGHDFVTNDIAPIPADSGHPEHLRLGFLLEGRIPGVAGLEYCEAV